jgi:DNA polymerase
MIEDVRALIRYHQVLGIKDYPWHCETPHFIDGMSETPAKGAGMLPSPEKLPIRPVSVRETLADIDAEIEECCNCELHTGRLIAVAGRGQVRARLLIVGGWLTGSGQAAPSSEMIFGLEQDRMVARMLEAIQLKGDDVFVTNILKCGLPESCQPLATHLQCCLGYLQRQIAVIGPEVICSMGIIATRALLGLPQSLSQLRGRFHPYPTLDGRQIPVMPTYHPSYLLQAEEMKQETWKDLQLIQKRLAR